jgi:hypothetical protein
MASHLSLSILRPGPKAATGNRPQGNGARPASALGCTRSRCGTGSGRSGTGLSRCRRYQVACGTPAAAQAARVPICGASRAIAIGHELDSCPVSVLPEIVYRQF